MNFFGLFFGIIKLIVIKKLDEGLVDKICFRDLIECNN